MSKKENKTKTVIERVQLELDKIEKNQHRVCFFVLDTKGNPSGTLEYIYKLAYLLKETDYNVVMLYQEDEEFVGVKDWLGEQYASLPHENIAKEETSVSPSDILFIPEIFANVMTQAKQLPCKKVAILQNYDYITEQIPLSVQWGDLNVLDAITNTEANEKLLKTIFPYVKTQVVHPYIDEVFHVSTEPKKMIVNIVSKDPNNINRIIKPFYWSYPLFKWVTFRDLRGFSNQELADKLREGAITIYIDDDESFGYGALEALKCGAVVMAKLSHNELPWASDKNGELIEQVAWFDNVRQLPRMIAQLVRGWITNALPEQLVIGKEEVVSQYSKEQTASEITSYVKTLVDKRQQELKNLISAIKLQDKEL